MTRDRIQYRPTHTDTAWDTTSDNCWSLWGWYLTLASCPATDMVFHSDSVSSTHTGPYEAGIMVVSSHQGLLRLASNRCQLPSHVKPYVQALVHFVSILDIPLWRMPLHINTIWLNHCNSLVTWGFLLRPKGVYVTCQKLWSHPKCKRLGTICQDSSPRLAYSEPSSLSNLTYLVNEWHKEMLSHCEILHTGTSFCVPH